MIDLEELAVALAEMGQRSKLFNVVKAEMVKREHWKYRPRGKSFKKGSDNRRKKLN